MPNLLTSRKFWLMVVDVFVSLLTYFVTKYVEPAAAKDVLFVIASLQPVIIAVIAAITVQNIQGQRDAARQKIAQAQLNATPPFVDNE